MTAIRSRRPGRSFPTRPFSSLLLSLSVLVPVALTHARAQTTMLWPEMSWLIAPESGIGASEWGPPQPVAGWGNAGSGSIGILGFSPAADPVGWMDSVFTGIRFEKWETLIYRARREEARSEDLNAGYSVVHAATPLFSDGIFLMVGGTATECVTRMRFAERGYLHRSRAETHSWLGVRANGNGWDCLLSWGHLGFVRGAGEAAAALRVRLRDQTSVSAWGSRRVAADGMIAVYDQDDAAVVAPFTQTTLGMGLTGTIGLWRVLMRAERTAGYGRGAGEPVHRLRPRPGMTLAELRIESPGGRWQAAAGAGWGKHGLDLESLGLRYGRFLVHDNRFWVRAAYNTQWKGKGFQLWSGFTRSDFDGEGDLEFWPFTPTLIDLLGLRRRAVADASLNVVSAGGRGSLLSDDFSLILGADLHHAWTDGRIESWEPLVLGVGRTNILIDRLVVRSAQLLDLGVQFQFPAAGDITIQGGAAQLIPLAVQKRSIPGIVPPAEPSERGAAVEWGGLRWWVTILLDLLIVGGDV